MASEQHDHFQSKKKVRPTTRPETVGLFLLGAKTLGLSLEELNHIDMGMVYDMMIEKANNDYEWPYKATKDDIDKF